MKFIPFTIILFFMFGCTSHKQSSVDATIVPSSTTKQDGEWVIRIIDSSENSIVDKYRLYYLADKLYAYIALAPNAIDYDSSVINKGDTIVAYHMGKIYNDSSLTTKYGLISTDTSINSSSLINRKFKQLFGNYSDILYYSTSLDFVFKELKVDSFFNKDTSVVSFQGSLSRPYGIFSGDFVDSISLVLVNKKLIQITYNEVDYDGSQESADNLNKPIKNRIDFVYFNDTLKKMNYYTIDTINRLYNTSIFIYQENHNLPAFKE
jgi:hypothetical protein